MATNKPELRVVSEADRRPRKAESPMQLFERAMRGASNDEALELTLRSIENLAERAETAADIGIDADDRDVENEALVFVAAASETSNWLSSNPRIKASHNTMGDAKRDLEASMQNRRARLDGKWSRVEEFSHRRKARIRSAYAVEAARETRARDDLLERANLTPERVLAAMRKALEASPEVKAKDVTVALMPELADTSIVGRQTVVNRVSRIMRRLVGEGALVQHRHGDNDGGRNTCSYAMAEDCDAS